MGPRVCSVSSCLCPAALVRLRVLVGCLFGGGGEGGAGVHAQFSLCLQGPYYWVLKGSRALTMRSLEGSGLFIEEGPLVD